LLKKIDDLIADSVAILAPFKKSNPFVLEKASKYLKMAAANGLPEVGIFSFCWLQRHVKFGNILSQLLQYRFFLINTVKLTEEVVLSSYWRWNKQI
jgi:hypothetical protein